MERGNALVVDDEEPIRSLVARLLRDLGYRPRVADGAAQALRMTESEAFALVVADYEMPGMSGLELIRIVRARWPQTRFILMTGRIDAAVLREVGAGTVLSKPFALEDVRRAVERLSESGGPAQMPSGR